jgi:uncharacterized protein (DUF305 family)
MRRSTRVSLALAFLCASPAGWAQSQPHHEPAGTPQLPPPPVPETSFAAQMMQAMDRMHAAMAGAPRTGQPDRDFLAAMIPHHQGAIEMAKAVLLTTNDASIRNLAQSIITEQQSEIELMKRLLGEASTATSSPREDGP